MKTARVVIDHMTYDATESDGNVLLADGRLVAQEDVAWLPPLAPAGRGRPRTILALDLNYIGHAGGLEFRPPAEPLAFLKSEGALGGHRAFVQRPAGARFMHYECELAVVIGRRASKVRKDDAWDFIGGYTVANDWTPGSHHPEGGYRPNPRMKNRDGLTPIGPWLVDAAEIHARPGGPMELALETLVNGRITQSGNTRDMIFDVPTLIEYFTSFMTLEAGDLILTGTPPGVVDCQPGDVVVCEIDGVGALECSVAGDEPVVAETVP